MVIAGGPASPVLAGPVVMFTFKTVHVEVINTKAIIIINNPSTSQCL